MRHLPHWKGVGGLMYGVVISIACCALLLSLIQTFRIHQNGTNTQNMIDAISDGTAYYMSTQSLDTTSSTDDTSAEQQDTQAQKQKKYDVALKEANTLNKQIAKELNMSPLTDLTVNQDSLDDDVVAVQGKSTNSYMNRFFQQRMNSQFYFIYRHARSKYNSGMFGADVDVNSQYYIKTSAGGLNPFPNGNQDGVDPPKGSALPNCTSYAYGRVYEVSGSEPGGLPRCGAAGWWAAATCAKDTKTPKVGAIACWQGHVAYIESIQGDTVTITDSHAYHQKSMNDLLDQPGMLYSTQTWPISKLYQPYGGHKFQGFLYPQTVTG